MNIREKLIEETKQDGRQLVSIRKINDLIPIPGADRIETAMIGGWPVVVKKGDFQVGQLCVFFEVDSFLNNEDERFKFLCTKQSKKIIDGVETDVIEDTSSEWKGIKGIRLRTIRLRKQLSQGLILPLNQFPEMATESVDKKSWIIPHPDNYEEGVTPQFEEIGKYPDEMSETYQRVRQMNFTKVLGVIKWEKVERKSGGANLAGKQAGNFPSFISKSDQPRCQNLNQEIFGYGQREVPFNVDGIPPEAINEMLRTGKLFKNDTGLIRVYPASATPDEKYEVSIKLDGSSMTAYVLHEVDDDGNPIKKLGVCSRNFELKTEGNDGNAFVDVFHKSVKPVLELNHGFGDIALQGELMGTGIQGNQEGIDGHEFYVYNIFDIEDQEYMIPPKRKEVLTKLNELAEAECLPPIKSVPVLFDSVTLGELGITNMQELLKYAEGPSLNPKVAREGLVFKCLTRQFQFKAISNTWLEKNQ